MRERPMEWRWTHPCVKWCNCMATGEGIMIFIVSKRQLICFLPNGGWMVWCSPKFLVEFFCGLNALWYIYIYIWVKQFASVFSYFHIFTGACNNESKTNRNNLRIYRQIILEVTLICTRIPGNFDLLSFTLRTFSTRINVVIRPTISLSDFLLS